MSKIMISTSTHYQEGKEVTSFQSPGDIQPFASFEAHFQWSETRRIVAIAVEDGFVIERVAIGHTTYPTLSYRDEIVLPNVTVTVQTRSTTKVAWPLYGAVITSKPITSRQ